MAGVNELNGIKIRSSERAIRLIVNMFLQI